MDVDLRLEALEEENERLRDELEYLRESLGCHFLAPLQFHLTGAETKIFGRLLKGGAVSKNAFMAILYRDMAQDEAEIKIVDVFMCKLRKKLKPWDMAELGRSGGLKGGNARAAALTPEQRSEIAKKAAAKRWNR